MPLGTTWERGEYPTPSATRYGSSQNEGEVPHERPSAGTPSLDTWAANLWMTPDCPNGGRPPGPGQSATGAMPDGSKRQVGLENQAQNWPTPRAAENGQNRNFPERGKALSAAIDSWPTPTSFSKASEGVNRPGNNRSANKTLGIVANWPTPRASANENRTTKNAPSHGDGHGYTLAGMAGSWPTPTAGDAKASGSRNTEGSEAHAGVSLSDMVTTGDSAGRSNRETLRPLWETPMAGANRKSERAMLRSTENGRRSGGGQSSYPGLEQQGDMVAGRLGRTTPRDGSDGPLRAVLNPSFVETLQGFPVGWTDCAVSATPSSGSKPSSPSAS